VDQRIRWYGHRRESAHSAGKLPTFEKKNRSQGDPLGVRGRNVGGRSVPIGGGSSLWGTAASRKLESSPERKIVEGNAGNPRIGENTPLGRIEGLGGQKKRPPLGEKDRRAPRTYPWGKGCRLAVIRERRK